MLCGAVHCPLMLLCSWRSCLPSSSSRQSKSTTAATQVSCRLTASTAAGCTRQAVLCAEAWHDIYRYECRMACFTMCTADVVQNALKILFRHDASCPRSHCVLLWLYCSGAGRAGRGDQAVDSAHGISRDARLVTYCFESIYGHRLPLCAQ